MPGSVLYAFSHVTPKLASYSSHEVDAVVGLARPFSAPSPFV
jgi:hypothetical protein